MIRGLGKLLPNIYSRPRASPTPREPATNIYGSIGNYIEVLKPHETSLLIFIGGSAAVIAGAGHPALNPFLLSLVAIALGSAGCNGLTNYIDREVDARMQRTRQRVLPSRRIDPAQKVLPLTVGLVVAALALAWLLNPLCFVAGLGGTVAAVVKRKTAMSHMLGGISGNAPLLIGWFAINPKADLTLFFLCLLILVWVPLHVWSVMIAYRDDYLKAGLRIFPVTWEIQDIIKVLLTLSLFLYAVSLTLYFAVHLGLLYLVAANLLGLAMLLATARLLRGFASQDAWRVYKLSAYPYLGLIFLAMCLDLWL